MEAPQSKNDNLGARERHNHALEEFKALRAEILLRLQLRSQLLALAVTLFAAIAALTANGAFPKDVLLVYPILALFISCEWTNHDLRMFSAAQYIKRQIEPELKGLGWQHHLDDYRKDRRLRLSAFAAGGVFVVASVIAMLLASLDIAGLIKRYGVFVWPIGIVDVLSICGAIWSL